ncbi:activating signal cointegrator 1 [Phtheirospermum japonicum]|uniref:Activating signal cointegrator 1 n=1 Tax=Phtheirospermum japonicum TaxID=374723 RepID=A0A830BK11_9LAMI|nr:activating signal cointegrator 1 [Phtheirospermum japonicum]
MGETRRRCGRGARIIDVFFLFRVRGRSWREKQLKETMAYGAKAQSVLLLWRRCKSICRRRGEMETLHTGRLWIHAAGKVPEPETIKIMEDFYREIYAMNGVTDIKFPEHYPISRLLGCVNIVGCVTCEELVSWEAIPASVRVEGQTAFCWLCEQPQKLIVPFEMRGYRGVYNLERKIYEAAARGLSPVKALQPVNFPLPNPQDPFSLKPGSLASHSACSINYEEEKSPSLVAAIAGARAAATQFSKNKIEDAEEP